MIDEAYNNHHHKNFQDIYSFFITHLCRVVFLQSGYTILASKPSITIDIVNGLHI